MRILEVNGVSLLGATHQEAVNALRAAGNHIQLIVCKGYDKSSLVHSIGTAGGMSTGFSGSNNRLDSRTSETGSELSQSVSSLDRDDGVDDNINSTSNASVSFFLLSFFLYFLVFCYIACSVLINIGQKLKFNYNNLYDFKNVSLFIFSFNIVFLFFGWDSVQANEVFESNKNERKSPEPQIENDDRVAVTSRDVALINSDLDLANTKERSTKDKVNATIMKEKTISKLKQNRISFSFFFCCLE